MGISGKLCFVGNGGVTKNPLFWLQHIWCYILLLMVFTLQDRTSDDLDLVWLEALLTPYRGYSSVLSGKLWLSGKMKSKIGCVGGWVVSRFCLSRSAIELRVTLT